MTSLSAKTRSWISQARIKGVWRNYSSLATGAKNPCVAFREYCRVHVRHFWCKGIWTVNAIPTSRHQDCLLLFITSMVDRWAFLYRRQVMDLWAKKWREGSFVPRHSSVGGSVRQNSKNNLHIKIKIKRKLVTWKRFIKTVALAVWNCCFKGWYVQVMQLVTKTVTETCGLRISGRSITLSYNTKDSGSNPKTTLKFLD